MADSYRYSKSRKLNKHSKNIREEEIAKPKIRKSRHSKDTSKHYHIESKTPPLPVKSGCSLEELLRHRESLKQELKKVTKYSESNVESQHKSEKRHRHSKEDTKTQSKKRYDNDCEDDRKVKKKRSIKESSPDFNDYSQYDSEDEDHIIEQRRQLRKQLIEKLKDSREERHDNKKESLVFENKKNICIENISSRNDTNSEKKETIVKETTDMFSEKDDFVHKKGSSHITQDNSENIAQLNDNWDDPEGYYNIRIGDKINNNKYTIKCILGQGVFANVVRAKNDNEENSEVAIKIVRNNDLMYRTGLKEIAILNEINKADPENRYHCVKLLGNFMHKGHLCLILESLYMDLRAILKKYGKNHGINTKALMSYSRQLLLAVRLLKKVGIIHCDIKPDNILVNEKKNILKLCDFGSASKAGDNEPTPYLVSRFYRAPEIILGIPYKHGVDIWSTACTIYEMATGKIMFTGSSNNKMLKCFMDVKGRIPNKLIRKGKFKDQHFNYNNNFLLHKKDEISGREKIIEISNINVVRDIHSELKKSAKSLTPEEEKKLLQLRDLLDKMTTIDQHQRISPDDCLRHSFIQEQLQK